MSANLLLTVIRVNRCNVAAVTAALRNTTLAVLRRGWADRFPGAKAPTTREAFIAYACAHEAAYV